MLLKTSFSYTKKFFQRTLQTFKSLLPGGYQRLPKTPPFNPFRSSFCCRGGAAAHINVHPSCEELDKFYTELIADQWGYSDNKERKRSKKKKKNQEDQHEEIYSRAGSFMNLPKSKMVNTNKDHEIERREDRSHLVAQKLRELEMMDMGNVDHVLDIEEVLHYYSRLTCPAYLHMVDKFFMDIFSEFFSPSSTTASTISRR